MRVAHTALVFLGVVEVTFRGSCPGDREAADAATGDPRRRVVKVRVHHDSPLSCRGCGYALDICEKFGCDADSGVIEGDGHGYDANTGITHGSPL